MLNAASTEAYRSQMRFRHGAVITKGGKLLAAGHNHVRTRFSGPLASNDAITLPFEMMHDSSSPYGTAAAAHSGASSSSTAADGYGHSGNGYMVSSSHVNGSSGASHQAQSASSSSADHGAVSGGSGGNAGHAQSSGGAHSVGQHSFSMHAEMHAITSALRGARPQRHKSHVSIDPYVAALALASSSSSTCPQQQQQQRNGNKSKLKHKSKDSSKTSAASARLRDSSTALPAQAPWWLKPPGRSRLWEEEPRRSGSGAQSTLGSCRLPQPAPFLRSQRVRRSFAPAARRRHVRCSPVAGCRV